MKYLFSAINMIGLLVCWAGVAINVHWVAIYSIEAFKGRRPLDWGFTFLFSLELVVLGGAAVALASLVAVASATKLPALLGARLISKLFFAGVSLFVLSLVVQVLVNAYLSK